MVWDVRGYYVPGVHFMRGGSDPQNVRWNRTRHYRGFAVLLALKMTENEVETQARLIRSEKEE